MLGAAAAAGWLPRLLLERVARGEAEGSPCGARFAVAVLQVDVSGFTALTERLAERGPAGAELLSEVLNARFGALIDTVLDHGGDITHFAGDAIVAVWPVSASAPLAEAVQRAAACGLALQALPALAQADEAPLRVRAGVSAGDAWWAVLGGDAAQAFIVGGAPLAAAGVAAAAGEPGDVVVDDAAWPLLPAATARAPVGPGLHRLAPLPVARSGQHQPLPVPVPVPVPVLPPSPPAARVSDRAGVPLAEAADSADAALQARFLPAVLHTRLASASDWLAEFRHVTVLFVSFGDGDFAAPERLAQAQAAALAVQEVVRRFDGALHQFVADGPGAVLIAAWGLPSVTHEDDARRGAAAALAIERALLALGLPCAIGVTTGRVFCGTRGNLRRREWAILGSRMNLAARLMRAAGRGVLCDADTAQAARGHLGFEAQPAVALKGIAQPVAVFRPSAAPAAPRQAEATALVGRADQLSRIDARLDAFVGRAEGGVLVLEGEAGIGKSRLLNEVGQRASARGAVVLHGQADAIEDATAYYVWRSVLGALFPTTNDNAAASAGARVLAALADDPALVERAPLLNDVLALDLPDSAVTAAMESQGRADSLRDLVAELLRRAGARAPLVLMLDDAHWFDSASWAMTAAVARRVPQVLFVIALRPVAEPLPPALRQLLVAGAERLVLPPLAPAETLDLVCQRLGVAALPPAVEAFVHDKAQGNPYFSEQIVLALCDAGHLLVADGACRLAATAGDLHALGLPDTVQGVVNGRIDRLPPSEQLTLKVASAIGRTFRFLLLSDVYPSMAARPALRGDLDHLTTIDLTQRDAPEPDPSHMFTHVVTQQVAYDLMSFAQRRQLHRAIADWFETRFGDDLAPHLPLLAHHWAKADEPALAVSYLERAAEQALDRFANEEVLRFVREARALAVSGSLDISAVRRSRWEFHEGEALLKLARYEDSRQHFLESLRLLGRGVPPSRLGLVRRLGLEGWRQLLRRFGGLPPVPANGMVTSNEADTREALLQCAHAHQRLAEVGYWNNDILSLVHSAVASLNYAEAAGLSRQLQLGHHVLGFVAGLAGSRALFERYRRHADAVAPQVQHVETVAFCAQLDTIYFNGQARWAEADAAARRGAALFERVGDRFRWQSCVVLRGWGQLHQGDVAGAQAAFTQAEAMVGAEGPTQVQVWSSAGLLAAALAGQPHISPARIAGLEALLASGVDHSDAIMCRGLLALAQLRAGDSQAALAHAARATTFIDKLPPASFHTLLGTAAVVATHIAHWQRSGDLGSRKAALHGLRGLSRFAMVHPIGKPYLWRARAEFARHDGKLKRAERCAARALAEATRLGMTLAPVMSDLD